MAAFHSDSVGLDACGQSCAFIWHNPTVVHRQGAFAQLVPVGQTAGTDLHPQAWGSGKCWRALEKPVLSTAAPAPYYYDYLSIQTIEEQPPYHPDRRAVFTFHVAAYGGGYRWQRWRALSGRAGIKKAAEAAPGCCATGRQSPGGVRKAIRASSGRGRLNR